MRTQAFVMFRTNTVSKHATVEMSLYKGPKFAWVTYIGITVTIIPLE